jgi:sulfur carrier protein ThiS
VGRGGAEKDLLGLTRPGWPDPPIEPFILPMEVEVHLFANLAEYRPPGGRTGPVRMELPTGATLHDLLRRLRIPDEVPRLCLVNGRDVEPTVRLSAGDVVSVLPPLVGG